MLKSLLIKLFQLFILILDYFWPKEKKIIICGSNSGKKMSGNSKIIYEYLKNKKKYKSYYYLNDNYTSNSDILNYKNLKSILIFLKAKTLIGSHGLGDFGPFMWSNKKTFIQTWHGTPLKTIGFADGSEKKNHLKNLVTHNKKVDVLLTTSDFSSGLISRCFNISDRKIFPIGYPRNDSLAGLNNNHMHKLEELDIKLPKHKNVILYAPTYRRWENAKFFPFKDMNFEQLNIFLENNNSILFLRGHINDNFSQNEIQSSKRIMILNDNICPDINDYLQNIDVLITDYSSIYFDYLLLNRPCIFIPYDLKLYKEKRGLLLDDYDFWAPGPKVLDFRSFLNEISNIINNDDQYQDKRKIINRIINNKQTKNSSQKVIELIERLNK